MKYNNEIHSIQNVQLSQQMHINTRYLPTQQYRERILNNFEPTIFNYKISNYLLLFYLLQYLPLLIDYCFIRESNKLQTALTLNKTITLHRKVDA